MSTRVDASWIPRRHSVICHGSKLLCPPLCSLILSRSLALFRFHGKRPGKKLLDKYAVRRERKDPMKKKQGSSTDALSTVEKQKKKQEQLQAPYIILSGTGKDQHQLHK